MWIHDNYGIAKSSKDQGVVAREKQSVKQVNFFIVHSEFYFSTNQTSKKAKTRNSAKPDQASKSQPHVKKTKIIDLTQDNINFNIEKYRLSLKEYQLEIEDRKD